MAASLKLYPGNTIRWHDRWYLIVDCEGLDAVIARQPGKRRVERIRISEIQPNHAARAVSRPTPDLVAIPEEAWQVAVKRFKVLKPLLSEGSTARTWQMSRRLLVCLVSIPLRSIDGSKTTNTPSVSQFSCERSAPIEGQVAFRAKSIRSSTPPSTRSISRLKSQRYRR